MTNHTLVERLEAAAGPSLILDRDVALAAHIGSKPVAGNDSRISVWDGNGYTQLTVKPYTASLDAAITLVPEGCLYTAHTLWDRDTTAGFASVSRYELGEFNGHPHRYWMDEHRCASTTPALALCAAALRARTLSSPDTDRGGQ